MFQWKMYVVILKSIKAKMSFVYLFGGGNQRIRFLIAKFRTSTTRPVIAKTSYIAEQPSYSCRIRLEKGLSEELDYTPDVTNNADF